MKGKRLPGPEPGCLWKLWGIAMKELGFRIVPEMSRTIRKVYIELTDRCNLNCSHCYRKSWEIPPRDMAMDLFHQIADELKRLEGVEKIVLGGIGEPMFHRDILEVLDTLAGYDLHITTNGTIMGEALMRKMIETVKTITISVDGEADVFRDIRGVELSSIVANLSRLEKLKTELNSPYPTVEIQFVMSKDNIGEIYKVMDLTKRLKAQRLVISNLIPQSEENKDKILYQLYPTETNEQLCRELSHYSRRNGCMNVHIPAMAIKTERHCSFIEDVTTYITAEGDIVPCYRLSHDSDEYVFGRKKRVRKNSFGNLRDASILEIWNSETYRKFRAMIYNQQYPSCMDCDLVTGCDWPEDTLGDCYGNSPSCSDCLWARKIVVCP